jgi:hypothetical protein
VSKPIEESIEYGEDESPGDYEEGLRECTECGEIIDKLFHYQHDGMCQNCYDRAMLLI